MSRTVKWIIFLFIGLIIVFLVVYPRLGFMKADSNQTAGTPAAGTPAAEASAAGMPKGHGNLGGGGGPVTVDALVLKASELSNKVISTGTVLANEEVEIRSEISGKVTHILFKEGDNVKKGQVLIRINDDELQAQRQKVEYSITLNETQESRQKKLLAKEAISQQEYDVILTQLNTVKADLQQLKAQIAKYTILAPFDGIIGLRYVSDGSYISPATLVASMQDIDPVKIEFNVSERYASLVNRGSQLTFTINGQGQEDRYKAEVYAVEPRIDLATRSVKVRAHCPNPDRKLIPGAFARVELSVGSINNAVMIPTEALIPSLQGQSVFLYKNGLARLVTVQTGTRTDRQVQITRGVQASDSLIVTGLLQLKDSNQVKVTILEKDLSGNPALTKE